MKTAYEVYLHTVEDAGSESFLDLGEFPPLDPDDGDDEFGRLLGIAEDPLAALIAAEQCSGAERGRWVNENVVQDEYGDFVRAGRPPRASPDGHPWPAGHHIVNVVGDGPGSSSSTTACEARRMT
ncbi:hypothetical protein [Streptomyces sp. NPDC059072]|uniref:hypothetical protein n=1 Tax=Streptomyces sp. NPDC059072 TaxID=3346715 RepID=UPI003677A8A8